MTKWKKLVLLLQRTTFLEFDQNLTITLASKHLPVQKAIETLEKVVKYV